MKKGKEKRDLFTELMAGLREIKAHREGKITLKTYRVEAPERPLASPDFLIDTRKRLNLSRAVMARSLRINERNLEKWEQGRAKPSSEAVTLIALARQYPDTIERVGKIFKTSGKPKKKSA